MSIMKQFMLVLAAAMASPILAQAHEANPGAVDCDSCEQWNVPVQPFKLVGNSWYVGVTGVSAVLVTGPQGHILLDGGLPQSAPLIEANIRALGFRMEDVKLILNSHAHWDHAGGIAALQRASGATVLASAASARALQGGTNTLDDPQYQAESVVHVPKVAQVTLIKDGEVVKLGPLQLTAHMTPGHTTGGTTWTWQSCENDRCLNMVYADSLNAYASGDFAFSGNDKTPDITASFRASIAKVAALPCDIMIPVHPGQVDLLEKAARRTADSDPLIDTGACRAYANAATAFLDKRLAKERAAR